MANWIVSANASSVTKTRKGLVDVSGTLLLEERSAAKEEEEADWEYLREVKRRFLRPPLLLLVLDVRGVDAIGVDGLLVCILEMNLLLDTPSIERWFDFICKSCEAREIDGKIMYFALSLYDRNDHTTVTAPLPVCSAKLSTVGPG